MKNILPIFSLLLFLAACQPEEDLTPSNPAHQYLKEISLGQEFTTSPRVIRKWTQDVEIYLPESAPDYLIEELETILAELNTLIGQIKLLRVKDRTKANFIIFLGKGEDYLALDPSAADYIEDNLGLFTVHWNQACEILQGAMYVDITRVRNRQEQRHLLREELTQALGLFNDSPRYTESIFQQAWTHTTNYSSLDKEVIRLLYNIKLVPCTTEEELDRILGQ